MNPGAPTASSRGAVFLPPGQSLRGRTRQGIQMQAAREAAKQPNKYNTVSEGEGEGGEEERAKHWQRQDALREKELKDIEAQRTWDRSYWNNVLSEARDLARNRASAGKYQVVR